jgi:ABC-type cobalamin/Fe3+-siderophores transport system ATPase subunit
MSSENSRPILEVENIGFRYERNRPFIDDLSFTTSNGEFIGLLGANGSGKSTILKLAGGILRQTSGEIRLWGKPIHSYPHKDRAKLICYLPQVLDMNLPFKVRELVSMGLYPYDIPPALTTMEALEMVGLGDKSESYLGNLSGGERRRVFIGMTLLQGAGLLLLDEPLANLDIKYQLEIQRLLTKLKEDNKMSIVMALHDINIALQFEKVMLIKDGGILATGTPENVLTNTLLREAFDADIRIRKNETGATYMSYENGRP